MSESQVPPSSRVRPLSHEAVAHREAFRQYVVDQAEGWHREHLTRLYVLWEQWNRDFFEGGLVVPYVLLAEPSAPNVYGDCSTVSGFGGRSQIRLRPSLLAGTHPRVRPGDEYAEGRFRFIADVLLHEQVHQYHHEVTGRREPGYHGHGPAFRDECNRIGATLGLGRVRASKPRGLDVVFPSCAQWPHNVRASDYYLGALTTKKKAPPITTPGDDLFIAASRVGAEINVAAILALINAAIRYHDSSKNRARRRETFSAHMLRQLIRGHASPSNKEEHR